MENKIETNEVSSEQIDVPEGILEFLQIKSGISLPCKQKTYPVSGMIKCLRKSFYEKSGKKRKARGFENLWPTVRGDLLHQMTQAYKWNELDINFEIPLGNGNIGIVSGRLDMYDWKTKTIIDLKTTKDVYVQTENHSIPRKEDILQIQCYGTIFSNIIPVKNLVLVYADLNDLIAFKIKNEDKTWWLKERILKLENSLDTKEPPTREISKSCDYCKYRNVCNPKEDHIFIGGKPVSHMQTGGFEN